MRFIPLLGIAAILAAAGCTDVRAVNDTREDRREFTLTGDRLVIESSGADLRLVAGTGKKLEVERSLTGKATADDNAAWEMDGGTLRLNVTCSGFVPDCGGRHIVHIPSGVAITVTSDSPVRAVGLDGALTATVTDAWLRVENPTGALRLTAEANVDVTGARSADVTATSGERNVTLDFAGAPTSVRAKANGNVAVTLPGGPETYRVSAAPGKPALRSDPASERSITATAGEGRTARVRKAA
ncbi:hypothetical protein [Phytohabitans aurantiacus]|jgi:hypothetical protein|uniref:Adhesin domain-containing protein n=1 Tax=Phytohabitans aurantiacus TaxID=3016789 RepID=A0ABQ5QWX2_9ACTN|nr:hypothetical protein [Phytohabitans aurantiacus]GLH98762.1 hypothetical protein Pa4123_40370 [Phytohabitans aurantiacus]